MHRGRRIPAAARKSSKQTELEPPPKISGIQTHSRKDRTFEEQEAYGKYWAMVGKAKRLSDLARRALVYPGSCATSSYVVRDAALLLAVKACVLVSAIISLFFGFSL